MVPGIWIAAPSTGISVSRTSAVRRSRQWSLSRIPLLSLLSKTRVRLTIGATLVTLFTEEPNRM